jgi:hypothetical protein
MEDDTMEKHLFVASLNPSGPHPLAVQEGDVQLFVERCGDDVVMTDIRAPKYFMDMLLARDPRALRFVERLVVQVPPRLGYLGHKCHALVESLLNQTYDTLCQPDPELTLVERDSPTAA